jgi:hypothetical protein
MDNDLASDARTGASRQSNGLMDERVRVDEVSAFRTRRRIGMQNFLLFSYLALSFAPSSDFQFDRKDASELKYDGTYASSRRIQISTRDQTLRVHLTWKIGESSVGVADLPIVWELPEVTSYSFQVDGRPTPLYGDKEGIYRVIQPLRRGARLDLELTFSFDANDIAFSALAAGASEVVLGRESGAWGWRIGGERAPMGSQIPSGGSFPSSGGSRIEIFHEESRPPPPKRGMFAPSCAIEVQANPLGHALEAKIKMGDDLGQHQLRFETERFPDFFAASRGALAARAGDSIRIQSDGKKRRTSGEITLKWQRATGGTSSPTRVKIPRILGDDNQPIRCSLRVVPDPRVHWRRVNGEQEIEIVAVEPVPLPEISVDVAAYDISLTPEGRVVVQARYEIRNRARPMLRVTLPANATMLRTEVDGEEAELVRGARGEWCIAMPRSWIFQQAEFRFGVEMSYIFDSKPWRRHVRQELPLPILDADIATIRSSVYFPQQYREIARSRERVSTFSKGESIHYGRRLNAAELSAVDRAIRDVLRDISRGDLERARSGLKKLQQRGLVHPNLNILSAAVNAKTDAEIFEERELAANDVQEGESIESTEMANAVDDPTSFVARRQRKDDRNERVSGGVSGGVPGGVPAGVIQGSMGAAVEGSEESEEIEVSETRPGAGEEQTSGINVGKDFLARVPIVRATASGGAVRTFEASASTSSETAISLNGTSSPISRAESPPSKARSTPPRVFALHGLLAVPTFGQPLRYHHLLVPAKSAISLSIDLRRRFLRSFRE